VKLIRKLKKKPVIIKLTRKEAKRLRDSSLYDFIWSDTSEEDLWDEFNSILDKALGGEMKVIKPDKEVPVVIEFTRDEADRLRTSANLDFSWVETTEEDLWGRFYDVMTEALNR